MMKVRLEIAILLALLLAVAPCSKAQSAGDIVVGPDDNLHDALRQAREWRRTGDPRCKDGIRIIVKAGRHHMVQPLFLRPEDSGTDASPTLIVGEDGAVLCGDIPQRHTQLFPKKGMERIVDFDKERRIITIPTPPQEVLESKGLEMVLQQRWAIAILRVREMKARGTVTEVSFLEPESKLEFEHPWPQPVVDGEKGNSAFLLRTTEQRDGIEQLVVVAGTEEQPVTHLTLSNLTFENTCWNRPLHQGHVTLQGGFPIIDAYKLKQEGLPWAPTLENQAWIERPVAAVSISWARQVSVEGCFFINLASTALDFTYGIDQCRVDNCTFRDIGGTAILAGSFAESPREVHRPYPLLARQCRHLAITNNRIENATIEDWGAVAIGCGYVSNVSIECNVVDGVNYSGICVGWGWTPEKTGMEGNVIRGNTVKNYARQLYDVGAIYTLSCQPGSVMEGNVISPHTPAPYATNDRCFPIYLDAATDGYTLKNNHLEGRGLIGKDDIGFNNPGPDIHLE
ncbi:MAG: right-handed parallel beta-helix repeat-containing protein [Prevotella sp.]|nr:right-handed parallel beta-helix repeat-containing protein [Prevotella sp.]